VRRLLATLRSQIMTVATVVQHARKVPAPTHSPMTPHKHCHVCRWQAAAIQDGKAYAFNLDYDNPLPLATLLLLQSGAAYPPQYAQLANHLNMLLGRCVTTAVLRAVRHIDGSTHLTTRCHSTNTPPASSCHVITWFVQVAGQVSPLPAGACQQCTHTDRERVLEGSASGLASLLGHMEWLTCRPCQVITCTSAPQCQHTCCASTATALVSAWCLAPACMHAG
jgi:hypothetical protein